MREGAQDDCERLIKTVIGSGWSEEDKKDKGVKIELKRGRGISTQRVTKHYFHEEGISRIS